MKKSLCLVVSSPMTVNAFLQEPIKQLAHDYQIYLVCNGSTPDVSAQIQPYLTVLTVAIERQITLIGDLAALWQLYWIFRKYSFDVVHSVTPKAGLLAMLAGYLARVRIRIHTFTGQVWATRTGLGRWLLKTMDSVIAAMATHVLVDSPSQLQFLLAEKVVSQRKCNVLSKGSISGVDTARFCANAQTREKLRSALKIPDAAIVFLFLGRLNRDKGVMDLAAAFNRVACENPVAYLLVVGPDEGHFTSAMMEVLGESADRTRFVGHTDRPEDYMSAADVFCLPSYREGFGSVVIEAAAAGLPAIGSRIYGVVDAIAEGETGLLHKAGDIAGLQACMLQLASSNELRRTLGRQARERAVSDFSSQALAAAWLTYYRGLQ